MNKQQIMGLLNIGENREIEFKEAKKQLPNSLWSTYSAFANSKGGIIVLGINDDNISMFEIETKKIIIINVPKANRRNKPIYINNNPIIGTYKRFHE